MTFKVSFETSSGGETIFFGAMNGNSWYKMPAKALREGKSDTIISNSIEKAGNKPFSDGAITDADGNHYFTNLQEHAITKIRCCWQTDQYHTR